MGLQDDDGSGGERMKSVKKRVTTSVTKSEAGTGIGRMEHVRLLALLTGALLFAVGCSTAGMANAGRAGETADGAQAAAANGAVTAAPAAVGLSAARLARVDERLADYIDRGELVGAQVMVARRDEVVHDSVLGDAMLDGSRPVRHDTLWRIYSMTKPVASIALMMLYEEGAFLLDDPLSMYLPEYADMTVLVDGEQVPAQRPITIRQLFTHTAGFSYGFTERGVDALYREDHPLGKQDLAAFSAHLAELPLAFEPGTRWNYSVSIDVIGRLVEVLSGQSFDRFLDERIFTPLGMEDTFFSVPDGKLDRFGTNHRMDPETGRLVVVEEPALGIRWRDTTLFSGGGGLVSTAADYMRLCRMLLRGGELGGVRLLSPRTVDFMARNHVPAAVLEQGGVFGAGTTLGFGLGYAVVEDPVMLGGQSTGAVASEGEYWWGGAAGTAFWIDPEQELIAILMIQRMDAPRRLRAELKALVNAAIVD